MYYYHTGGKNYGPVTREELEALAAAGDIIGRTPVIEVGSKVWTRWRLLNAPDAAEAELPPPPPEDEDDPPRTEAKRFPLSLWPLVLLIIAAGSGVSMLLSYYTLSTAQAKSDHMTDRISELKESTARAKERSRIITTLAPDKLKLDHQIEMQESLLKHLEAQMGTVESEETVTTLRKRVEELRGQLDELDKQFR